MDLAKEFIKFVNRGNLIQTIPELTFMILCVLVFVPMNTFFPWQSVHRDIRHGTLLIVKGNIATEIRNEKVEKYDNI